jgi:nucleoid-associated protein YgaU
LSPDVPDSIFRNPAKPDNRDKIMVTVTQLREAYATAAANGQTNEELAAALGIKLQSLQQNLTTARKDLREIGTTEDELKLIFPPLKRRTGPRTSKRAEALLAMRDAARAAAAPPQDEAPPEAPAEPTDSELEALTAPTPAE